MKRVLHIAPSFARRDGGPSEVLRGLIPELARIGYEVTTATTDKGVDESDLSFVASNNVRVFSARRPARWSFAPSMLLKLRAEIRNSDVVHIHSVNTFPTTLAMVLCRWTRTPYLLEPHGAFDIYHMDQGRMKKVLYNVLIDGYGFRGLAGAIYSSAREREHGSKTLHARAFEMPLGVDSRLFDINRQPLNSGRASTLLFLGRITEKKRLDLVIRALAAKSLSDSGIRLIVAGPEDPRLGYDPRKLALDLGVAERVEFLGAVDEQLREKLLLSADVFILPSEDESFGMAVAEAMAAGCPVIATVNVGIAEAAAASGAIEICALDAHSIAQTIATMFNDAARRQSMGASGKAYAMENFTWSRAAAKAAFAYEAVT
jgi:glycosyltransferase involved in cell wall biosynthesis